MGKAKNHTREGVSATFMFDGLCRCPETRMAKNRFVGNMHSFEAKI